MGIMGFAGAFVAAGYFDRVIETFRTTRWTGWVTLFVAIFVGLAAGKVASTVLQKIGERLVTRGWVARGTVLSSGATPAALALFTLGLSVGVAGLALAPEVGTFVRKVLAFLYTLAGAWYLFNLISLLDMTLRRLAGLTKSSLDDAIIPLIRRTTQIFLIVVFVLFVAQNIFGADITAWLAGLGVAGLAVSLAAQDSIKNLFGSVTIYMDRMFKIGDRIVFAEHDGTVEEIGFRSTRIRTADGNLAIVPNSRFVESSLVNVSRRPHIRREMNIGITCDTPPEKIEEAVKIVRQILADPEIASAFDTEKSPPRAAFDDMGADHLRIKVLYWFQPADGWAYLEHAQAFNLKLIRAFAGAGIEFAFPTRTLYLAGDPRRQLAVRHAADPAGIRLEGVGMDAHKDVPLPSR